VRPAGLHLFDFLPEYLRPLPEIDMAARPITAAGESWRSALTLRAVEWRLYAATGRPGAAATA
jgi:hypothetical protein